MPSDQPNFTPGPWIADDGDADNWGVFSDATRDAVCYLYDTHSGAPYVTEPINSSANANLIAAAPDMYAALTSMRSWLKFHVDHHIEHREPKHSTSVTGTDGWAVAAIPDWDARQKLDDLNAALAKADGKAGA